jgi:hypothetical protein
MLGHVLCQARVFAVACTGNESLHGAPIDEPVLARNLPGGPIRALLR